MSVGSDSLRAMHRRQKQKWFLHATNIRPSQSIEVIIHECACSMTQKVVLVTTKSYPFFLVGSLQLLKAGTVLWSQQCQGGACKTCYVRTTFPLL